jgi:hypothetical protein
MAPTGVQHTDFEHRRSPVQPWIPLRRAGWRLSPAYDLNPVPADIKPRILTTAINEDHGTASLDVAMSVAAYFELEKHKAQAIAAQVGKAGHGGTKRTAQDRKRRDRSHGIGVRARRSEKSTGKVTRFAHMRFNRIVLFPPNQASRSSSQALTIVTQRGTPAYLPVEGRFAALLAVFGFRLFVSRCPLSELPV